MITLKVESGNSSIDINISLMYSIKSVGPKMEPGVTPSLTGYSYEDFLSGTT